MGTEHLFEVREDLDEAGMTYRRLLRAPRALRRRGADALFDLETLRRRGRRIPSGKMVIVHAGFRKTGTTTIQTMFRQNEALLAEHVGVVMRTTVPSSEDMHRAGHDYAPSPSRATARAVRRAARDMNAAIAALPQRAVILSDENIIGRHLVCGSRDVFDIAADVLAIVREEFGEHDVHIVLTTRERTGWLKSCFNQDVKRHKFVGDESAWMARNSGCRDWQAGSRRLQAALSASVRLVAMEDDLAEGRFLGRSILEMANVPDEVLEQVVPPPRQNLSLDQTQLELISEINALDLPFSVTSRIVDVVRRRTDLLRPPGITAS